MLWIESFLDYLRFERNYSIETIKSYEGDLTQFGAFLQKEATDPGSGASIDASQVRGWVVHLMDNGYSTTSINRKLSTLRSYFKFLLRKKLTDTDPMIGIKGPKNKKVLPSFVRESDMDRLLDDEDFGDDFKGRRDHMIVEMFYSTGMRLSELIGLEDVDLDFGAMTVKVRGKRDKERIIPITAGLRRSLEDYISLRDSIGLPVVEALFIRENGCRLKRGDVVTIVKRSLSKVVTIKKRSPHVLRHTFATSMLNHGADLGVIKEILGHESLATTEIYTHTTFEELKRVYKQAHPRS